MERRGGFLPVCFNGLGTVREVNEREGHAELHEVLTGTGKHARIFSVDDQPVRGAGDDGRKEGLREDGEASCFLGQRASAITLISLTGATGFKPKAARSRGRGSCTFSATQSLSKGRANDRHAERTSRNR